MSEFIEQNGVMVHLDIEELERIGREACEQISPPSQELLDNIQFTLNTEYQRQRSSEYPSIQDQLDTLYHGGYDVWKAQIEAVKNKYPKPE